MHKFFISQETTLQLHESLFKIEPPQRLGTQDLCTADIKVLCHVREVLSNGECNV